jgi:hypothetical protein
MSCRKRSTSFHSRTFQEDTHRHKLCHPAVCSRGRTHNRLRSLRCTWRSVYHMQHRSYSLWGRIHRGTCSHIDCLCATDLNPCMKCMWWLIRRIRYSSRCMECMIHLTRRNEHCIACTESHSHKIRKLRDILLDYNYISENGRILTFAGVVTGTQVSFRRTLRNTSAVVEMG